MAPTPVPNGSYISPFPILPEDLSVTVYPNGEDDWDNIQHCLNEMEGKNGAQINFVAGSYFHRYMLISKDNRIQLLGAGSTRTKIFEGTPTSRILPLDETDQALFNPSGVPLGQLLQYADTLPHISLTLQNLCFSGSLLQGYVCYATQFGSDVPALRNAGCQSNVAIFGGRPNIGVNNMELTMDGTDPQSTGFTDIIQPQLRDAPDVGTVVYEEGVDYTVDRAAGTFTRIGGGAITDGQVVYAHFNACNTYNQVARSDFTFRDCLFTCGVLQSEGVNYSSIEQCIIAFCPASYGPDLPGEYQVFHNESYVDLPGYIEKRYSREGTFLLNQPDANDFSETPFVGTASVHDCTFQNASLGFFFDGIEGVQTTGTSPYEYLSSSPIQSAVTIERCTFVDVANCAFGYTSLFMDQTMGVTYTFLNNSFDRVLSMIGTGLGENYGADQSNFDYVRLPGWEGRPCSVEFGDVTVGNMSSIFTQEFFGAFNPPPLSIDDTHLQTDVGVSAEDVHVHDVVVNWLDDSIIPNATRNQGGLRVFYVSGVVAEDLRFVSKTPGKAQAAVEVVAGQVTARRCDVSEWSLRPGIADYVLGDESVNSSITALDESDTVQVAAGATGSMINNATIIP